MRPVSDAFVKALYNDHRAVIRCEAVNAQGDVVGVLTPLDGEVQVDRTADIRRSFTMQLTTQPEDFDDLMLLVHPRTGNEMRLWRGIHADSLGAATDELVPLGVFAVADINVSDGGRQLLVDISGYDRSWRVQRAKRTDAWASANYTRDIATLIGDEILANEAPWLPRKFTPTGLDASGVHTMKPEDDVWKKCTSLAYAGRQELFVDAEGFAVLRPNPRYRRREVAFEWVEGGLLTDAAIATDLEHTWNAVVVTSETPSSNLPVRAVAEDNDPSSATYIRGPLGRIPFFTSTRYAISATWLRLIAELLLLLASGWQEDVTWSGVSNPAVEEGDRVRIRRDRMGLDAVYLVERLTIPLSASGEMRGSARRRVIS